MVKWLNPVFTKDFIPAAILPVRLFLPTSSMSDFIKNEPKLLPATYSGISVVPVGDTRNRRKTECTVKKGEFFHKIAITYRCRISDIVYWNNLKSRNLYPGQKLTVWEFVPDDSFFIIDELNIVNRKKSINFNYSLSR